MRRRAASLLAGFVLFVVPSASVRAAEPPAPQPAPPAATAKADGGDDALKVCRAAEFQKNTQVAAFLADYDRAAWLTSDLVVAEPGFDSSAMSREWFCYEDGGVWHAVYGKYTEGQPYRVVYHYVADGHGFVRATTAPDPARVDLYPALLHAAEGRLPEEFKLNRRLLNPYVRPLPDGKVEVRYIPGQKGDFIYVGFDLAYVFDAATRAFVSADEVVAPGGVRAVKPDRAAPLYIPNQGRDVATPGQIFQLLSLRRDFDMVIIESKRCSSTLIEEDGKILGWLNVDRENPPVPSAAPGASPRH